MTTFERSDVQGIVVSGYAQMHEARYVLLEVADDGGARRWLRELSDRVTASSGAEEVRCLNVALTCAGLGALGLGADELRSFPPPFQEGMTTPYRQRILGDHGCSAPEHWAWGGPERPGSDPDEHRLHVLLLLFAHDRAAVEALLAEEAERAVADGSLRLLKTLVPLPLPGTMRIGKFGFEHFGFADGMSQPVIEGSGQDAGLAGAEARRQVVATGEFVLGYPNGYGELTPSPWISAPDGRQVDVGRNGSYLVVRQLAQDVHGFREAVRRAAGSAADDPEATERLAAKLVGRWRSGAPLVRTPHRDDPDLGTDNAFGYAEVDPHGERCPVGAHVRRSNPRDSIGPTPSRALTLANRHRLVRRGRVYGPAFPDDAPRDDGVERGLIFMCVNANIERQFEFVQQTWCNNPKFGGLHDEQDPVLGTRPPDGGTFTVQGAPVATRVRELPTFVTVRGGAYFFLPGIRALRSLAALRT